MILYLLLDMFHTDGWGILLKYLIFFFT